MCYCIEYVIITDEYFFVTLSYLSLTMFLSCILPCCGLSGDRVVALLEKAWDVKTLVGFRWTEVI